jgi:Concanavalin A-like lectin/glucanases superfamily
VPLWIAFLTLLCLLCLELVAPEKVMEGFQSVTFKSADLKPADPTSIAPSNSLFAQAFKRRSDVGPNQEPRGSWGEFKRYYADYTDVQGVGSSNDYCRVVFPSGAPESESFFACALAGTDGLSTVEYRSKAVKEGFALSRDDYMKNITPNGRYAYCRIVKTGAEFMPMCAVPGLNSFDGQDVMDSEPPDDIKTLVDFYRDCRMWLRFYDDMKDYMGSQTVLQVAGGAAVSEAPRPTITRALHFNGIDQFVRFGDNRDLSLGNTGSMRSVRAFSVWVKFDEFTNNAHIFDFGDGAGKNNVFLGILGKGDPDSSAGNAIRPGTKCEESTVPGPGSGAQFCPELRAEDLYRISAANVDEFVCTGPEVQADPTKAQQLSTRPPKVPVDPNAKASRATLLYEVWDSSLRVMQIKINQAIPLGQWTHIVITAANMDAMRPNIRVYINGNYAYTKDNGFLPQAATTKKNYIGKSNWADNSSGYELRDELLSGSVFDFRMYTSALSEAKIKRTLQWGMDKLGLAVTQTPADVADTRGSASNSDPAPAPYPGATSE